MGFSPMAISNSELSNKQRLCRSFLLPQSSIIPTTKQPCQSPSCLKAHSVLLAGPSSPSFLLFHPQPATPTPIQTLNTKSEMCYTPHLKAKCNHTYLEHKALSSDNCARNPGSAACVRTSVYWEIDVDVLCHNCADDAVRRGRNEMMMSRGRRGDDERDVSEEGRSEVRRIRRVLGR